MLKGKNHLAIVLFFFAFSVASFLGNHCNHETSRPLSARYQALFYEALARFLQAQQDGECLYITLHYGFNLHEQIQYTRARVSSMAYNESEASRWPNLFSSFITPHFVNVLATQASAYYSSYRLMRNADIVHSLIPEEYDTETENSMINRVLTHFPYPDLSNNFYLAYEMLRFYNLPIMVSLMQFNQVGNSVFYLELAEPHARFVSEPSVPEYPQIIGYYRTPMPFRFYENVRNDLHILRRAYRSLTREFIVNVGYFAPSSRAPNMLVDFVAVSVRDYARTALSTIFGDAQPSAEVSYRVLLTTFLRLLFEFVHYELCWLECHPALQYIHGSTTVWREIDDYNDMINDAYDALLRSVRNYEWSVESLYRALRARRIHVGFSLRDNSALFIVDNANVVARTERETS